MTHSRRLHNWHASLWMGLLALGALAAGCGASATGLEDVVPGGSDSAVFDGISTLPDGVTVLPDGRAIPDDGGATLPDGAVVFTDGAVVFHDGAAVSDGGAPRPDAGPVARIGTPCRTDDDCPGRFCSPAGNGFGYCSWLCNDAMPCPEDAVCAVFQRGSSGYCMQRCDPQASVCARGYLCEPGIADAPVCYPGCGSDADCATGERCGMGASGVRDCYTPTASVGGECTTSGQCPEAGYCLDENSWGTPRGECITFCDLGTRAGCSAASTCVAWGFGGAGSCVPTCDDAHPCRGGYACVPTGAGGPSACVPRCSTDADCATGHSCSFVTGRCG